MFCKLRTWLLSSATYGSSVIQRWNCTPKPCNSYICNKWCEDLFGCSCEISCTIEIDGFLSSAEDKLFSDIWLNSHTDFKLDPKKCISTDSSICGLFKSERIVWCDLKFRPSVNVFQVRCVKMRFYTVTKERTCSSAADPFAWTLIPLPWREALSFTHTCLLVFCTLWGLVTRSLPLGSTFSTRLLPDMVLTAKIMPFF